MRSKKDIQQYVKYFFKDVGVPPAIFDKFSGNQVQGEARTFCGQVGFQIQNTEKMMPWANHAERCVFIFKNYITKELKASNE